MKISALRIAAVLGGVLLTASACGSGSGNTSSTTKPAAKAAGSTSAASTSAGLHVASTSLGKVLVDGKGMTVYLLTSDKPNKSLCSSSCLTYWPAVAPSTGATGVTGKVAQTTTTAGAPIATVGGWPLYTYAGDKAPGDATGQGQKSFGGIWYAVSASGKAVTGSSGAKPSSGSSSSGGGYGY